MKTFIFDAKHQSQNGVFKEKGSVVGKGHFSHSKAALLGCFGVLAMSAGAAWAGSPSANTPLADSLVQDAPATGFINDGDQSVVETLFVYLDGCPLVSITPPVSGKGQPAVTMIEQTGECATSVGLADKDNLAIPAEMMDDGGMHVQLWRDDPSELTTVALDPDAPNPSNSLIVEISSLYPDADPLPSDDDGAVYAFGGAPTFWIPGVFGDPSGDLLVAAADPTGSNTPVLFGIGGNSNGIALGGSSGGGSGSDSGSDSDDGSSIQTPFFTSNPGSGPGLPGSGGNSPGIAAVPLPATLLLLLWAFQMMRSFVRRR